jgi:c-di-GMP-binding flagellar brake protein YcgR
MEEKKKTEKRRFVRVDMTIPVKYRNFKNDPILKSHFNVGRGRDISLGGLKWAVSKHNPVNSKLDMEIVLSDTLSAYVVAKVVGGENKVVDGIVHQFDRVTFLEMDQKAQNVLTRQVLEGLRKKRS